MNADNIVTDTVAHLKDRGGPIFHELPVPARPLAMIRRFLGLPVHTHTYERLDGKRIKLTSEEKAGIAPIELELFSKGVARQMMRDRQRRMKAAGL